MRGGGLQLASPPFCWVCAEMFLDNVGRLTTLHSKSARMKILADKALVSWV